MIYSEVAAGVALRPGLAVDAAARLADERVEVQASGSENPRLRSSGVEFCLGLPLISGGLNPQKEDIDQSLGQEMQDLCSKTQNHRRALRIG